MATLLSPVSQQAFSEAAATAAAYLDACDCNCRQVELDPAYYRQSAYLLTKMFTLFDAYRNFPEVLAQSAAAREIADSIRIGRLLETSCLVYYPQLAAVLGRAAA